MRVFVLPVFYISMIALSVLLLFLIWTGNTVFAQKITGDSSHYYDVVLDSSEKQTPQPTTTQKNTSSSPLINAPLIDQRPELVRGCEVTSLAMLLQTAGIKVDKLTLAKQVKKDPTPKTDVKGMIHYGNPNIGFVGNMYDLNEPGYGVYHGPLMALAQSYLGNRAIDLTGMSFDIVLNQLREGIPVMVITSTTFKKIPASDWQTWETESGPIKVSKKEHAVLLTGYSNNRLYLNDPLRGKKNEVTNRDAFIQAWKQFGSQAISYKAN